jgi:predicted DNA-binding ribbon-helix-helix protein
MSDMRGHSVTIRLNDTEFKLLKERAEREGRSVSNMIRVAVFVKSAPIKIDSVGQVVRD